MGPAISLVTNVPVGKPINLLTSGAPFVIINRGPDNADLSAIGATPMIGGMPLWEYGYEPIPDGSWITCDPNSMGIGAPAEVPLAVTVTVPDDARWAGRKFVAGILVKSGREEGVGAGLAMCARLLFETTDRFESGAGGGWLATVPGTIRIEEVPAGTSEVRLLKLRNGTDAPLHIIARRLDDIEARVDKRSDYLTAKPVPTAWMAAPEPVEIPSGGEITLRMPFTIPADAAPGAYEDVIFFATADAWAVVDTAKANNGQRSTQPRTAAVRVRFEVVLP